MYDENPPYCEGGFVKNNNFLQIYYNQFLTSFNISVLLFLDKDH